MTNYPPQNQSSINYQSDQVRERNWIIFKQNFSAYFGKFNDDSDGAAAFKLFEKNDVSKFPPWSTVTKAYQYVVPFNVVLSSKNCAPSLISDVNNVAF